MRTGRFITTAFLTAASAGAALAGPIVFSNYANFASTPPFGAQASAVTASNDAIVVPFLSNTASMEIVLSEASFVRTVRVLAPTLNVRNSNSILPGAGLHADGSHDVDQRPGPIPSSDPSSLAPLRVSIYASAADVASRNVFASVDFNAGDYTHELWSENSSFYDVTFDLGQTFDLSAGDWFFEVAQIDPDPVQFFLAIGAGSGMHAFDPFSNAFVRTNSDFAIELGSGVIIPLPTGGALGLVGMTVLAIARRRRG